MFTSKLTEEDREQMYEWALEGVTLREITNRLKGKVTYQRVQQLLRKNGIRPKTARDVQKIKEDRETLLRYVSKFFKGEKIVVDREVLEAALDKYHQKKTTNPEFQVAFEDIEWHTHCPVFGTLLDYSRGASKGFNKDNAASFDRVDNSKGYVKGNVTVVSYRANRIKSDGSAEDHRLISNYMFERNVK